mmetsp:Transcript_23827/g.59036  ORF Transcript_23827/g.59036 Transcript_23827/m.59036 type:complete len:419 (-) Transcript_23827:232-1488(-)
MKRARTDGTVSEQKDPDMAVLSPYGGHDTLTTGCHIEMLVPSRISQALLSYAAKHVPPVSLKASHGGDSGSEDEADVSEGGKGDIKLSLGHGEYELEHDGHKFMLHSLGWGKVVKGGRNASLVLSHATGGTAVRDAMQGFLAKVVEEHEKNRKGHIALYCYNCEYGCWTKEKSLRKRSLSSIILPSSVMDSLVGDVRKFLDADTKGWFLKNFIPYKRTFLLHGPPGCGKSSLITAVASEFDCSVCMMSLADPKLTDYALLSAMQSVPKKSVLYFEDIDALFDTHREAKDTRVTFAGLLNALDGVGDPRGTVSFLTTNHKDHLDGALVRPGRVDVHIELSYATDDQISRTFLRFYPEATAADRSTFVSAVRKNGSKRVTMAQLQEHFIQHRLNPIETAAREIHLGEATHEVSNGKMMWS